ncbi:MAG: response regulator transcription factor [Anaerolineae bacterium]|nr:response regulator transcription factor [Anaerolineae bacterium]
MDDQFSIPVSQVKILVVDDDPAMLEALVRSFGLSGYQVEGVLTGEEALEKLDTEPFHLMLIDLHLSGVQGLDVLCQGRRMQPRLLAIVLTAHADLENAIEAIRAGAVDYLLKPCRLRDIEAAITRVLRVWQADMRRQHLLDVIAGALEELRKEEAWGEGSDGKPERFVRCRALTLDREKRLVIVDSDEDQPNAPVELTVNEMNVLAQLMEHPDTMYTCQDLAKLALNEEMDDLDARAIIRPHISRLRNKIEANPRRPLFIVTVRGKGYMFPLVVAKAERKKRR